jgi:hypothetical protein
MKKKLDLKKNIINIYFFYKLFKENKLFYEHWNEISIPEWKYQCNKWKHGKYCFLLFFLPIVVNDRIYHWNIAIPQCITSNIYNVAGKIAVREVFIVSLPYINH